MDGIVCDACDRELLIEDPVRYIVKIEVYAAYDPMELTPDDLRRATPEAYRKLLKELEEADPEELEKQVHVAFQFDLCPRCQREYIRSPLRVKGPGGEPG